MTDTIDFQMERFETASLPAEVFDAVKQLFAENYRDANIAYLEKNLGKLRYLGFARGPNGDPAGFAIGELRTLDIPRVGLTVTRLAGLCCVSPAFRRQKLFGRLENLAMIAPRTPVPDRVLGCGRTAHPASFRGFYNNPDAIPQRGRTLKPRPPRKPTIWPGVPGGFRNWTTGRAS